MFFCRKKQPSERNHIFIKDMIVEMGIGVYDDEKGRKQKVRINIDAELSVWPNAARDNLEDTVSYDLFVRHVIRLVEEKHFNLAEALADNIAEACLAEKGVRKIRVCVEKLEIYPYAIAGAEVIRIKA